MTDQTYPYWTVTLTPPPIEVLIRADTQADAADIAIELDLYINGDDCERDAPVGVGGDMSLKHLRNMLTPEYERDEDGNVQRARKPRPY
jgi:hypothetical protein